VCLLQDLLSSNQELQARLSILTEKRLRMSKQATTLESEIKRLESTGSGMQTDMGRLNDLIGKHVTMHQELQQVNSAMEADFVAQLKDLESESVAMDTKISEVVMRKDEVLDEIMEAERQMLLWEKKVQLEKETQAALDPQVGMGEVHAMEKEIHRMTLRASTLKAEKERLIKEIERGVHKREVLSLRFKSAPKPSKAATGETKKADGAGEMTKASLTKKLASMKKTVRASANSVSEYDNAILERKSNLEEMTAKLEELTAMYGDAEEKANELQNSINMQL
jgi:coiled-coil domain-containing protein 40